MTLNGLMIRNAAARSEGGVLSYAIRIPWYRALPFSSIVELHVDVDGQAVDDEQVRLELNGITYRIADLEPLWDRLWFPQDDAWVHVDDPRLAALETATITTTMRLRSPYIMVGPDTPLVSGASLTRQFDIQQTGASK